MSKIDFTKVRTAEAKAEAVARAAVEAVNAEARRLLAETDWYILRELESGTPAPAEIKTKRGEARSKVVVLPPPVHPQNAPANPGKIK